MVSLGYMTDSFNQIINQENQKPAEEKNRTEHKIQRFIFHRD